MSSVTIEFDENDVPNRVRSKDTSDRMITDAVFALIHAAAFQRGCSPGRVLSEAIDQMNAIQVTNLEVGA